MSGISGEVLSIVYNVFGSESKKHNITRNQISFDCPVCDNGRHKGNLEINYGNLVMKCWKCCEDPDGLSGSLRKLVRAYGRKRDLQMYDAVTEDFRPEYKRAGFTEGYKSNIKLPEEYIHMGTAKQNREFTEALNYLIRRGFTMDDINRYDIGYCTEGDYAGRIIIPSYDKDGDLNYFVARSYVGHRVPYKNPEVEKTEVIINHLSINWDSTVYLVEGMFDMMGLGHDNTIPLLGKYLHPKLFSEIVENAKANIVIVLDPDAKRNAYQIYQQLNSIPHLAGKIRVVDIPEYIEVDGKFISLDIAKIREMYGHRGVVKILRYARQLTYIDLVENGL